jgi:hypothetical protein
MPKTLVASTGAGPIEHDYWMPTDDGNVGAFTISNADLLDDLNGEHLCGIVGYTDEFVTNHPEYGPRTCIRILFQVLNGDNKGDRFSLMFGYSLGPKATLNAIVTAARQRPIEPGEEMNFDDLFGLKLYLFVTTKTNAKGYTNVYYGGCREAASSAKGAAKVPVAAGVAGSPADPFADD